MTHDDFYCREILSGNLKVDPLIETAYILAFHHTDPYWEKHVVIIPKKHIRSMSSFDPEDSELGIDLLRVIGEISGQMEKEYGGCRVSSNVGDYQSTQHLHFYIHAGKRLRAENGERIE